MSSEQTIDVREAARRLGVSLKNIYDLVWSGRLKADKVDGKWLISAPAVEARLKQRGEHA